MSFRPWLGKDVPRGWALTVLTDLTLTRSGDSKLIKGKLHSSPAVGLYKAFSASGQDVWHESFQYEMPGLVVSAVGARCGKTFLADGKWTAIANTHVVIPKAEAIDRKFLWYAINDENFWIRSGSAQPFVVVSKSLARTFALPPLVEQSRIVAKVEELLSDLDAGEAELKAAQKKLTQYRQSLLKAAVEGALTAPWREQQGARPAPTETAALLLQRILTERRARWEAKQLAKFKEQGKTPPAGWQKKYAEPVQPDTTGLPVLPEGWVWASLDQLAAIGTGVTPLRSKSQYFEGGSVPWVTSGALNDELVNSATELLTPLALQECRLDLYPAGALLVAMYGEGKTRGKCSELGLPATINQAIAALVLEGSSLECKSYLKTFLLKSYDDMRNQASGGVQPNLNLQIIRSISVPLPPTAEQVAMMELLQVQLDALREQQGAVETLLKQSTAQRQNILRAAFSGQLVPQDPSDEPASALLARIRAERAAQTPARKPRGRKTQEAA